MCRRLELEDGTVLAAEDNVDIIITCDNGISAIDQIRLAKELGLKVIVTDHHDIPFIEKEDGSKIYEVYGVFRLLEV